MLPPDAPNSLPAAAPTAPPPPHWQARADMSPPAHWVELVRQRAPQLLDSPQYASGLVPPKPQVSRWQGDAGRRAPEPVPSFPPAASQSERRAPAERRAPVTPVVVRTISESPAGTFRPSTSRGNARRSPHFRVRITRPDAGGVSFPEVAAANPANASWPERNPSATVPTTSPAVQSPAAQPASRRVVWHDRKGVAQEPVGYRESIPSPSLATDWPVLAVPVSPTPPEKSPAEARRTAALQWTPATENVWPELPPATETAPDTRRLLAALRHESELIREQQGL